MINELRCLILEWLFNVQLWIAPEKSKEETALVFAIQTYFGKRDDSQ